MEPLTVVLAEFYPRDNARGSHTEDYDLVTNKDARTPVLRRGEDFHFAVRFNRDFDDNLDAIRVSFSIGEYIVNRIMVFVIYYFSSSTLDKLISN